MTFQFMSPWLGIVLKSRANTVFWPMWATAASGYLSSLRYEAYTYIRTLYLLSALVRARRNNRLISTESAGITTT